MAASLLACTQVLAQSSTTELPGFELERLETNVGRGSVLIGNGELMVPGGVSFRVLSHYQRLPLVLSDGENDLQIVRDRVTTVLSASYGVASWLELGAQLPVVLWQQGDDPTESGLARLSAQGLGTPVIHARLGLLSQRQRPVDLSADLAVGLPVGTQQALSGDAGPRFQARMIMGKTLGWLQPSIEAGVLFRPTILLATDVGTEKSGASAEIHLGASVATRGKSVRGELGLRSILGSQLSMELLGGIRVPLLPELDAFVMAGPGMGSALGTPVFRVLAGVNFNSEPPPRISYLDEKEDARFQLAQVEPTAVFKDDSPRPVNTWELNGVSRQDARPREWTEREARAAQFDARGRLLLRSQSLFEQGSARLPQVVPPLDQTVERALERTRMGIIYVEWHSGRDASDMTSTLPIQRAQAVRKYLLDQGLLPSQVKIRPFEASGSSAAPSSTGEQMPLDPQTEYLVVTEVAAP
jgi:outer membrane protein OmpA-like peptidoglycan-associated protein